MSDTRIALRYAKPLLELADEKGVLDQVKKDIDGFVSLCQGAKDFLVMLRSPIIPHLKKTQLLRKIFKGNVNDLTLSFLEIMTRKSRESILPEAAEEFQLLYYQKMGFEQAQVTTTFPLDDKLRKAFEEVVSKLTGKKPVLSENINKSLIGGYILQIGDRQIDESVSGKLNALKLKFK